MHLLLLRARHYAYTPQTDSANTTQTPLGATELADTSASGRQLYVASSEKNRPSGTHGNVLETIQFKTKYSRHHTPTYIYNYIY